MPRTVAQIEAQIAKLQKEAQAMRVKEAKAVIERIKALIAEYELKPEDLFGGASSPGRSKAVAATPKAARSRRARSIKKVVDAPAPTSSSPKFSDGNGRTWSSKGKRPNWYKDAIAAGKTPQELMLDKQAVQGT